jgi:hypothetical protein
MTTKKTAVLLVLSMTFGYIVHDVVGMVNIFDNKRTQTVSMGSESSKVLGTASQDQFISAVIFNGSSYQPNHITVKKGNYVSITNTSPVERMWLVSGESTMSMNRPYAQGEQLKFISPREGVIELKDKLHPAIGLKITIGP